MLDYHIYSQLPQEDETPAPRANPAFRRLVHAYDQRPRLPMLARSEERELIGLYQDQDSSEALALLVEHHVPFVTNIAMQFARKNGMEYAIDDLLSEGLEAFTKAISRYRLKTHSARLASFARYHVSGKILTYVLANKNPYGIGTSSKERVLILNMPSILAEFRKKHGRDFRPGVTEDVTLLSRLTEVPEPVIRRVMLHRPALNSRDIDIHEMRNDFQPESAVARQEISRILVREVTRAAERLKPRDRDILMTLLSDDEEASTLRSVLARRYDITPERVGQIYRQAVGMIRDALKKRGIRSSSG